MIFNDICVRTLEALSEDVDDVAGFAHCVEMDCRGAVGDEVFALGSAPLCADLVDGFFVVLCLVEGFCEFERNVEGEGLREDAYLAVG